MQYFTAFLPVFFASAAVIAQAPPAPDSVPGKASRDALIRSELARDKGEITALEPSGLDGNGVYLGYSSGALVHCYGDDSCRDFAGTPGGAVTGAVSGIAVSSGAGKDIVWVAYPHGIIYRCSNHTCREFRR